MNAVKSFPELLEELYKSRYTGKVVLDVFNGTPRGFELPGPRVQFDRAPLDKSPEVPEAISV